MVGPETGILVVVEHKPNRLTGRDNLRNKKKSKQLAGTGIVHKQG